MTARSAQHRLDPVTVGVDPCLACRVRPVKLPGLAQPLCLVCFAAERQAAERQAAASPRYVTACVAGPECLGCGSGDVNANGALWWCNSCGMCTRVAT
ncbi:hypothetical protein [Streptomyces sp. 7-21]|jgi:hypothetical protein|uniref:hypothetical protein n=1 Tax=Streptomyces sp. 7-21 TaxID=2802283 RepID=UPI00191E7CFB|nr:hypothetical protein [Streptomyces sp. 7-21]MBL1067500.1 hypothetical protein [Streptomyces sp. 7-21]